jgi:trimeric autotransporter adhesin
MRPTSYRLLRAAPAPLVESTYFSHRWLGVLVMAAVTIACMAGVCPEALGQTISTYAGGGNPPTNLNDPDAVAVGPDGSVYFGMFDQVYRLTPGAVNPTLIAGAGNFCRCSGGDGGPATNAFIGFIQGLAVDGNGNVFIADNGVSIRRVDSASGVITTVAGPGSGFYAANVAVDARGNLYVPGAPPLVDPPPFPASPFPSGGSYIYRVDASTWNVTVVAGTGVYGSSGDGGPALAATISTTTIAVDGAGNLYFAQFGMDPNETGVPGTTIRKVDGNTGVITTVAGTGIGGFSGDGGPAVSARLAQDDGISADAAGNLFILDWVNFRVRRVDAVTGIISTVAGNGIGGTSGDGRLATDATISLSCDVPGLAVDGAENLFILACDTERIRRVDGGTGIITTVVRGNGRFGDGGPATGAALLEPSGVATDRAGNVFVTEVGNAQVRRVDRATGIVTTIAGIGVSGHAGDGGPAIGAKLAPFSATVDSSGNLYIADLYNNAIRKVSAADGFISTIAGGNTTGDFAGDGGPATSAHLWGPYAVAVDTAGNVFIADALNERIRRIDTTGTITTVAGTGVQGFSGDGGLAINAQLCFPQGIALDANNNIIISDSCNGRIRRVDVGTHTITTVAGGGLSGGPTEGVPATTVTLANPEGIAVDASGNIYIAEPGAPDVRRVDGSTWTITTVAGTPGNIGFSGDGGPATSAQLSAPEGVAVDSGGNLYIADQNNNRVRVVSLPPGNNTPPFITPRVTGGLGNNGWYTSNVSVSWSVTSQSAITSETGCATVVLADTTGQTITCSATNSAGTTSRSVTIKQDTMAPTFAYSGSLTYTVDQIVNITCSAQDPISGVASTNCPDRIFGAAYSFKLGSTTDTSATATDNAGNIGIGSVTFTVADTTSGLINLVNRWETKSGVAANMDTALAGAQAAFNKGNKTSGDNQLNSFTNQVNAQSGKSLTASQAAILIKLATALKE